jgi:hypothetical protein
MEYTAENLGAKYSIGDLTTMGVSSELASQYQAATD